MFDYTHAQSSAVITETCKVLVNAGFACNIVLTLKIHILLQLSASNLHEDMVSSEL